jgi:hypothetical protein
MQLAPCQGPGWNNSHVPFVGLQLRDLGYVTTHKDTQQYARWDITPVGKAALLQEVARRTPKPITIPANSGYAVFSAADSGFKRCKDQKEAEALAIQWAKESDGEEVFIVQVMKTLKAKVVVEEV